MEITIRRVNKKYHFEAESSNGIKVHVDASPDIGGENKGARPMELMLMSVGSCSAIDLINILNKQRQELEDINITVTGEREKNKIPSLFTDIHITYKLKGNLDPQKVDRAIKLALENYCSATKTLEKTAYITYSFTINQI